MRQFPPVMFATTARKPPEAAMTLAQRGKLTKVVLAVSFASLMVAFGSMSMGQSARDHRQERSRLELQDLQGRLDALKKGARPSELARIDALQKELDALKRATW
jgi:hypothetical protein